MNTMWAGRFLKQLDAEVNDFNSSISFDSRMFRQDIQGSLAHVSMLGAQGIISKEDVAKIADGLMGILADLESGKLPIDPTAEDIHMFVEAELTKRIGDMGKKLHTARSRNDQVALDTRLYLRDEIKEIAALVRGLIEALVQKAETYADAIMPGYTHMQRAQPITFGHHLLAYVNMFLRDLDRLADCKKRLNISPLGACALAGTTYSTDRQAVAAALNMDSACENSLDGVSDRDFVLELAADIAILMMHLSRIAEEIILWCSWEFRFVELDDAYSTGSSIMPQKKNPDIAELVRGKAGRTYGDLMALLTMMKGIPLAYNKDMQEDKEAIFDSVDTVKQCLRVFTPMLDTMRVCTEVMRQAAAKGFINATDCADYLVTKGMPFRSAYKVTGELVAYCIQEGKTLEALSMDEFKAYADIFDQGIYAAIAMDNCVMRRNSFGGTSADSVRQQIAHVKARLAAQ